MFYKHGHAKRASRTAEYKAWENMISRCHTNQAIYARYRIKGIIVCEKWRNSFSEFLADMGPRPSPRHSVDRINNDGNYEPGNCRWATGTEQMLNGRWKDYRKPICNVEGCTGIGNRKGLCNKHYLRIWYKSHHPPTHS